MSAPQTGDRNRPTIVYVTLGGNMGDRSAHLRAALRELGGHPGVELGAVSRVYETEFVGEGTQAPYLNACAEIRTSLEPVALLNLLQDTEVRHGRRPDTHMLPRPLDLDILLYGDLVSSDPRLTLPHPRARERAFVLEPLAEIAPAAIFPDSQETVAAACAKIRGDRGPWIQVRPELDMGSQGPE